MLKGIIFDADGVLVDSEKLIADAAILFFKELGAQVSHEDFKPFIGVGEQKFLEGVANLNNISLPDDARKQLYDIYKRIIKGNLRPVKGIEALIEKCRSKGLKIAVATSADMEKLEANFAAVGFSMSMFDAVVTGENVVHKKPSPDIFLYAASQLKLDPQNCLVFEDAINGIIAATAAGCKSVGIAGTFTKKELHMANWQATDHTEIPEEALSW
ncbi:MAG TPA: HAD-IA family hydrolase [Bacteroidales bacterium]|nr:HAD-IA family hydrolase [Bacteroidales bacterium]